MCPDGSGPGFGHCHVQVVYTAKRKQKQGQSDIKKSKHDSARAVVVKEVEVEAVSEVSFVVYLQGQTSTLTSCNSFIVCRDIEKTFGPVQKVKHRGILLKLMCSSEKQRDVILGCTELGNISVTPSLPYSKPDS